MRTVIIVASLVIGLLVSPNVLGAFKHLKKGMEAPAVTGTDIRTGETVSLSGMLGEGVTVVVFWATWSERSLDQLQDLKKMTAQYGSDRFRVIAVNVEEQQITKESQTAIRAKVDQLDLPFPVITDQNLALFNEYGVIAVPSTAILNKEGIIEYGPAGYSYAIRDRFQDSTEVLLGLKSPAASQTLAEGRRPHPKAGRYYFLALKLYHKQMYERALGNIELATQADSGFAAPYSLRGEVELALKQPESAVSSFSKAAELDGEMVAAWAGWGRSLVLLRNFEEAAMKLRKALELDESYTPAMVDLAVAMDRMGTNGAALELIMGAHELNRTDASINHVLGMFHAVKGNTSEAVVAFRSALEILYPTP